MPTYTYLCKSCEQMMDVFHPMSANPRVKCKTCGGTTKKLMGTGAGIIFKGSGFYETDYKRKSGGESGGEKKSEGKSEGKGESKGEGKSEGKSEGKKEKTSTASSDSGKKSKE